MVHTSKFLGLPKIRKLDSKQHNSMLEYKVGQAIDLLYKLKIIFLQLVQFYDNKQIDNCFILY